MIFSRTNRKFRQVYNNYYALVLRVIRVKIKNMEDAEDICHEVFVSLYKKFDEIIDHKAWLMSAIHYTILGYYRDKGPEIYHDVMDETNNKSLSYENGVRDMRIILQEAITDEQNFKDDKEKILFDLIALKKFSYSQVARQLGLSRRQVEYRYIQVSKRIVGYLRSRGISKLEDML